MIRKSVYPIQGDVVPQAIFWRPICYFSTRIYKGEDELDEYKGASFSIGNSLNYDLRTYYGHPQSTVTMYLSFDIKTLRDIVHAIRMVISGMAIPRTAVAWRRGQDFTFGELRQPTNDRLVEAEARILSLKIAAQQPNRTASTEFIKSHVAEYVQLSQEDMRPSRTRRNEQRWQQIIGNVISHRNTPEGPFEMGYATRTDTGMVVTQAGVDYLNSIGFVV